MDNKAGQLMAGEGNYSQLVFCSCMNGAWAFLWGASHPRNVIWFHLESLIFLLISHIKDLAIQQSREKKRGAREWEQRDGDSHRAAETRQVNVLKTRPCPVKSAVPRFTDSGGYQRDARAAGWQLENPCFTCFQKNWNEAMLEGKKKQPANP